jgi:hypothetical protein
MKSKEARQDQKLLRNQFQSFNYLDIPTIKKSELKSMNLKFIGCDQLTNKKRATEDKSIHFFVDDYDFNKVYNNPEKYYKILAKFEAVLTPDFSLYTDMPLIIQMYSIFKNRWCGAYWQNKGLRTVIPTITWGDEKSYDFCFLGIEEGSIVAISTLNTCKEKELFMKGYNRMLEVIKPQLIYCYGVKPFPKMEGNILWIEYLSKAGRC